MNFGGKIFFERDVILKWRKRNNEIWFKKNIYIYGFNYRNRDLGKKCRMCVKKYILECGVNVINKYIYIEI